MLSGSASWKAIYNNDLLFRNEEYVIYVDWSGTQNYIKNTTTVTVNFYISADVVNLSYRDCSLTVNGKTYYFEIDSKYSAYITGVSKTLIYSITIDVKHDENGTKNLDISATWSYRKNKDLECSNQHPLDSIDRKAPEVTIVDLSNIGMYGFSANATTNVNSDDWGYSLDNGLTWISANGGLSNLNLNVTGLFKETEYSLCVRCKRIYNGVYGYSSPVTVKTIGSTIINSASFNPVDDDIVTGSINLNVLDLTHYHKLTFGFEGNSLFKTSAFVATLGENEVTLTSDERQMILYAIRNQKNGLFSVTIETFLDEECTQKLSTVSSVMIILETTEKSKPVFTDFTYEDSVREVVDVTGNNQVLIQKYSNLLVHCVEATPLNESSIVKYEAYINDVYAVNSGTDIDVGPLSEDGDFELSVICTDSRGYTTTIRKFIRVITYVDPNINSITLRRRNEVDRLIELSFRGAYSKIDADGINDTNAVTVAQYRYKLRSDEEYGEFISVLDSLSINSNTFSFGSEELLELDVEKTYDFHIQIKDRLDDMTVLDIYLVLNKLTPAISVRAGNSQYPFTRVGINNNSPKEAIDVVGNIAMNGYNVLGYVKTLKSGEGLRAQTKGGAYLFDGSYVCYDHPESGGTTPGILEVVCAGGFMLQRFTTLVSSSKEYKSAYNGTSWSMWSAD